MIIFDVYLNMHIHMCVNISVSMYFINIIFLNFIKYNILIIYLIYVICMKKFIFLLFFISFISINIFIPVWLKILHCRDSCSEIELCLVTRVRFNNALTIVTLSCGNIIFHGLLNQCHFQKYSFTWILMNKYYFDIDVMYMQIYKTLIITSPSI